MRQFLDSKFWSTEKVNDHKLDLIKEDWMVVYEHSQVGKQGRLNDPGSKKKRGEVKMIETSWKFYENMTFVSSKDREPGSWSIEYIKEGDKFVLNLE